MGTRGFVGFVADGNTCITYNHYDSYPSGVGADVLSWLSGADLTEAKGFAASMRVVSEENPPTPEELFRLERYYDPGVGGFSGPTWYQALRGTQGKPWEILVAGVYEDAGTFPADSLFCEWGYLVDFDTEVFEVYEGFQQEPHEKGRFADMEAEETVSSVGRTYYPVALVASWPLDALPDREGFLQALKDREELEQGLTHAVEQVTTMASEM